MGGVNTDHAFYRTLLCSQGQTQQLHIKRSTIRFQNIKRPSRGKRHISQTGHFAHVFALCAAVMVKQMWGRVGLPPIFPSHADRSLYDLKKGPLVRTAVSVGPVRTRPNFELNWQPSFAYASRFAESPCLHNDTRHALAFEHHDNRTARHTGETTHGVTAHG